MLQRSYGSSYEVREFATAEEMARELVSERIDHNKVIFAQRLEPLVSFAPLAAEIAVTRVDLSSGLMNEPEVSLG
jgi:hypothetical protein